MRYENHALELFCKASFTDADIHRASYITQNAQPQTSSHESLFFNFFFTIKSYEIFIAHVLNKKKSNNEEKALAKCAY